MAMFLNHYVCGHCDVEWRDRWSATCDDDCPSCGQTNSPFDSDDEEDESYLFKSDKGFYWARESDKLDTDFQPSRYYATEAEADANMPNDLEDIA